MILLIVINISTFVTNFKLDQDIIVSEKMMMNQFLIKLGLQVIHNLCFKRVSKLIRDSDQSEDIQWESEIDISIWKPAYVSNLSFNKSSIV